jgi:hypothetical protein
MRPVRAPRLLRGAQSSMSQRQPLELIALASGLGWMVVVGAHSPEDARRTVTDRLRRLFAAPPRQPDSGGAA